MKTPHLLGTSAAARELAKSEATIRALADRGALRSTRDAAGRRVFAAVDVARYKATELARASPPLPLEPEET